MFKAEVIGNLGADAKIKGENGREFISFNVAHTDKWTTSDGNEHSVTQWVSCIINDPKAKILQYLTKGKQVFVRGNAQLRVYSSEKERRMVAGIVINVRDIELVGGSSRLVPRQLHDADGIIYNINEAYYLDSDISQVPTILMSTDGNLFDVNNRWVKPSQKTLVISDNQSDKNTNDDNAI